MRRLNVTVKLKSFVFGLTVAATHLTEMPKYCSLLCLRLLCNGRGETLVGLEADDGGGDADDLCRALPRSSNVAVVSGGSARGVEGRGDAPVSACSACGWRGRWLSLRAEPEPAAGAAAAAAAAWPPVNCANASAILTCAHRSTMAANSGAMAAPCKAALPPCRSMRSPTAASGSPSQ